VDGKSLRGTRHSAADGQAVHLLAAADQRTGAVLSQRDVDGKTNEITRFEPLLEDLDLAGRVITADALHTQRETAEFVVTTKNAHYILIVKKNQPGLYATIKNLPWKDTPAGHSQQNQGHGRQECRDLKTAAVAAGLLFPHAARAIRITRRARPISGTGNWSTRTAYAVTSLNASQANPAELARWVRGHWRIEALHHIRDDTYGEEASQARAGNGPRAMATLRNLAIGALRTAGHPNIAAATRSHARDATRTIATLGLTPP
jgi:predicted transposase YbfD/YdcC